MSKIGEFLDQDAWERFLKADQERSRRMNPVAEKNDLIAAMTGLGWISYQKMCKAVVAQVKVRVGHPIRGISAFDWEDLFSDAKSSGLLLIKPYGRGHQYGLASECTPYKPRRWKFQGRVDDCCQCHLLQQSCPNCQRASEMDGDH